MLFCRCSILVFVASLLCLTSAFSTRFVIEGVEEGRKTPAAEETRTQKTEENKAAEKLTNSQGLEVEVIPIVADVFTQTEDLFNMTPLKLVSAIAAQHLLTTVQNIRVSGHTPQDTLNMLEGIAKEFNRTAQIIKLTADYVNISSQYILSTLNQFTKSSCEQRSVEKTLRSVRRNFLKTVTDHIAGAVNELNEKTRHREMTGSDILVSSAYHIVTAFQEMTNQVLSLIVDTNKQCNITLPWVEIKSVGEQSNATEEKPSDEMVLIVQPIPEQGKSHKSIKKDQATPRTANLMKQVSFDDVRNQMTIENLNANQDLTIEVFSPETFFQSKKKELVAEKNKEPKLQPLEDLKTEHVSLKNNSPFENFKKEAIPENTFEENNKINTKESTQTKSTDRELASSEVDSLSNVPWSTETEGKDLEKTVIVKDTDKSLKEFLNTLELLAPGYQNSLPLQYQPTAQCDERVEPVCGIDKRNKKFIIFLNDCKRTAHNRMYGMNYEWFKMDDCVGLFLRNKKQSVWEPSSQKQNSTTANVDLRPR